MRVAVRGAVSLFFALVPLADLTAPAVVAEQSTPAASRPVPLAPEYIIGADDVLTNTVVSQAQEYSGDVTVRPDGKIALSLIGEILVARLTPIQLRTELTKGYAKFFQAPDDSREREADQQPQGRDHRHNRQAGRVINVPIRFVPIPFVA
jgi:protein involved in polysaccharide export with SLBB domain